MLRKEKDLPLSTTPRVDGRLGGLTRECTGTLRAVICYSGKVQSESANRQSTRGEIQRKPGTSFQNPLPVELPSGKLIRDPVQSSVAAGPTGPLCLVCQAPDSQTESRC